MASRWTICSGLGHPFLLLLVLFVDEVVGDLLVVPEVGLARRHVVALPAHHALVPTATDDVVVARPVKDSLHLKTDWISCAQNATYCADMLNRFDT